MITKEAIRKLNRKLNPTTVINTDKTIEKIDYQALRKIDNNFIIEYAAILPSLQGKILECGCGMGRALELLKGRDIAGIDLSSRIVELLKADGLNVMKMDTADLKYTDNSFDTVFSIHALEHAEYFKKSLRESIRVCKSKAIHVFNIGKRGERIYKWEIENIEDFQGFLSDIPYQKILTTLSNGSCVLMIDKAVVEDGKTIDTDKKKLEIKAEVLEKSDAKIKGVYNYTIGCALDSAAKREGENIVEIGKILNSEISAEAGNIVTVAAYEVGTKKVNNKWNVDLLKADILGVDSTTKKPETARSILNRSNEIDILKVSNSVLNELLRLKLVKVSENKGGEEPEDNGRKDLSFTEIVKKEIPLIKDESRRIIYGVVYEPFDGTNIDAHGDYATLLEVEKAAHLFLEQYNSINLMHKKNIDDRAKVVESFIAPVNYQVNNHTVKKGSWIMAVHILDGKLWELIKSGEINAFSIEGIGSAGPALI